MISVNLTGRLTRDPELRHVPDPSSGRQLEVCQIRVAARDRRGQTVFLDLAEWGPAGRAAAEHLTTGSLVAFTGELRFREQQVNGTARQYLSAVGHIEFLDSRVRREEPAQDPAPAVPVAAVEADDIPF